MKLILDKIRERIISQQLPGEINRVANAFRQLARFIDQAQQNLPKAFRFFIRVYLCSSVAKAFSHALAARKKQKPR